MALANQPECYVWDDDLQPDQAVTWTAGCAGGFAEGTGTLTWVRDGKEKEAVESTGLLVNGKKYGRWVIRRKDGSGDTVRYVNGHRVD